jgi:hypothetical protein
MGLAESLQMEMAADRFFPLGQGVNRTADSVRATV